MGGSAREVWLSLLLLVLAAGYVLIGALALGAWQ
jgi:hypothetical protein